MKNANTTPAEKIESLKGKIARLENLLKSKDIFVPAIVKMWQAEVEKTRAELAEIEPAAAHGLAVSLIVLQTENGRFQFADHTTHPDTAPLKAYDLMTAFFAQNWQALLNGRASESYIVYFDDTEAEPVKFEGDNASAKLAVFMEDFK